MTNYPLPNEFTIDRFAPLPEPWMVSIEHVDRPALPHFREAVRTLISRHEWLRVRWQEVEGPVLLDIDEFGKMDVVENGDGLFWKGIAEAGTPWIGAFWEGDRLGVRGCHPLLDMHSRQVLAHDLRALLSGEALSEIPVGTSQFIWWLKQLPEEAAADRFWAAVPDSAAAGNKPVALTAVQEDSWSLDGAAENFSPASLASLWHGLLRRASYHGELKMAVETNGRPFAELSATVGPFSRCFLLDPAVLTEGQDAVARFFEQADEWQLYAPQQKPSGCFLIRIHDSEKPSQFSSDGIGAIAVLDIYPQISGGWRLMLSDELRLRLDTEVLAAAWRQCVGILQAGKTVSAEHVLKETGRQLAIQFPAEMSGDGTGPDDNHLLAPILRHLTDDPDRTAVIDSSQNWSRAEFSEVICQYYLYHPVVSNLQGGEPVVLSMGKNVHLLAAWLAIWLRGGVVVPLDPSYPPKRKDLIRKLSGAKHAIEQPLELSGLPLSEAPNFSPAFFETAYLLFTSGSTGQPKGCAVSHGALMAYLSHAARHYAKREPVSMACFSSISFDFTLTSLFLPLLTGGTVRFLDDGNPLDEVLLRVMSADGGMTVAKLTPSHIDMMSHLGITSSGIETVLVGGEALRPRHVASLRAWNASVRIINEYGPTEAAVGCVTSDIEMPEEADIIGRPNDRVQTRIVGADGNDCPEGWPGELWLSGDQLAGGYIGEGNSGAFCVEDGRRWYRTGDQVRFDAAVGLRYIGRKDDQVKVRGHRIELGEVIHALLSIPGIEQAHVQRHPRRSDELVAYAVMSEELSPRDVQRQLGEWLPPAAIPSHVVPIARMPLNAHGKLDASALPDPDGATERGRPPATPTELELVPLWAEALGRPVTGVDQNFFELGGQSLKAARLVARINRALGSNLNLRALYDHPTIGALAGRVDQISRKAAELPKYPRTERNPLTPSQRRLWMLHHVAPESHVYSMPGRFLIEGDIRPELLATALDEVLANHEVFRHRFRSEHGEPYVTVAERHDVEVEMIDAGESAVAEAAWSRVFGQAVDVENGPLARTAIVHLGPGRYEWWINIHHLISDGITEDLLVKELADRYSALSEGREYEAERVEARFVDYAKWLHEKRFGPGEETFWKERMAAPRRRLNLPVTKSVRDAGGRWQQMHFPADLVARLDDTARDQKTTPFVVLYAALGGFMGVVGEADRFDLGTAFSNRPFEELQGVAGFFVNSLPVRVDVSDAGLTVQGLIGQTADEMAAVQAHSDYPLESLLPQVRTAADLEQEPLFDVFVTYTERTQSLKLGDASVEAIRPDSFGAKFDLAFAFTRSAEGLRLEIDFDAGKMEPSVAEAMSVSFGRYLKTFLSAPAAPLDALRNQIAQYSGVLDDDEAAYATIPELWRRSMPGDASAVAIRDHGRDYTYAELDGFSRRVAKAVNERALSEKPVVAVWARNSWKLPACFLGVVRAGGIYLPIDAEWPETRVRLVLESSGAEVLLLPDAAQGIDGLADAVSVCTWDEIMATSSDFEEVSVDPEDTAYLIYTSGSTGRPKGVPVTHRAYGLTITDQIRFLGLDGGSRCLLWASPSFDASLSEMGLALFSGGVVIPFDQRSFAGSTAFRDFLSQENVDLATFTPTFLQVLDEISLPLQKFISAGEILSPALAARCLDKGYELYNAYGPTESAICVSMHRVTEQDLALDRVPVGRPLSATRVFVGDADGRPLPAGIPGELWLEGPKLAGRYWGAEELGGFGFLNGVPVYRTGDRSLIDLDGRIQILGRLNNQVKRRGHRIELDEIAAIVESLSGVQQAVCVTAQQYGQPSIHLFFRAVAGLEATSVEQALRRQLPEYMMPDSIDRVGAIPMTPSGKTDAQALVKIVSGQKRTEEDHAMELTDLNQREIAGIWSEILGVRPSSPASDFFEMGGNSLSAMELLGSWSRKFGHALTLREVYQNTTLKRQAELLESAPNRTTKPESVDQGTFRLSPQQETILHDLSIHDDGIRYLMPTAVEAVDVNLDDLKQALARLYEIHPELGIQLVGTETGVRNRYRTTKPYLEHRSWVGVPEGDQSGQLEDWLWRPMGFMEVPLAEWGVFERSDRRFWVGLRLHHLLGDARTMHVIVHTLADLLAGNAATESPGLRYAAYAEAAEAPEAEDYWHGQLADISNGESSLTYGLDEAASVSLTRPTLKPVVSPSQEYPLLLASAALATAAVLGKTRLWVACPSTGRTRSGFDETVGLFSHVQPLKLDIEGTATGSTLLQDIGQRWTSHLLAGPADASARAMGVRLPYDVEVQWHPEGLLRMPESSVIRPMSKGFNERKTRKYPLEWLFSDQGEARTVDLLATADHWNETSLSVLGVLQQMALEAIQQEPERLLGDLLDALAAAKTQMELERIKAARPKMGVLFDRN